MIQKRRIFMHIYSERGLGRNKLIFASLLAVVLIFNTCRAEELNASVEFP
jgi:hypothetical protein